VYVRRVDSLDIRLQASGSLWRDALVMQDPITGTLWSQMTGAAIQGPLRPARLEQYPSTMTTFVQFARRFPRGKLLVKPASVRGTPYADYYADPNALSIFGTRNPDPRQDGKSKVIGLSVGSTALAVPLSDSDAPRLIPATLGERGLIIYWDARTETAAVYARPSGRANDKLLVDPARPGSISTGDGAATWDALTGLPSVQMPGIAPLQPVPFLISYWFAWLSFYPHTQVAAH
jgi:hypothetical protein